MWPPEFIALIIATFFLAGVIKGMVGLGLPIVVLVFLAVPIGVQSAIALMLIPAIATNIWQAFSGPSLKMLVRRLWSFLLFSALGIWLGVNLLTYVAPSTLLAALGVVLIVYSIFSLNSPQIKPPGKFEPILSPLCGGLGGIGFGLTGTFIIPGIVYLQALGLKKDTLVQALGLTFVTLSTTMMSALLERGMMNRELLLYSGAALIPTALGIALGQRFRDHVSESLFRKLFFWALIFAGVYFIAAR